MYSHTGMEDDGNNYVGQEQEQIEESTINMDISVTSPPMSRSNSNFCQKFASSPVATVSTAAPPLQESNSISVLSKIIHSSSTSSLGFSSQSHSMTPENRVITSPLVNKRKPFNPFNINLRERLENPIFSPGVFSTVVSPSRDSEDFKWTIEDLSKINPAHIEEEFHFEEHTDEQTESEMQNTIDRYFTKKHNIPSPWDCKLPTSWRSLSEILKKEGQIESTENSAASSSPYSLSLARLALISNSSTPNQNVSTQTTLSLPLDLPAEVDSALRRYCEDNDVDDVDLSINSLRRKLFFQNDNNASSPIRNDRLEELSPLVNRCCPSTPVITNRSETPLKKFSPIDLSPISRIVKDETVCNNFTNEMQVDVSMQGTNDEIASNVDVCGNDAKRIREDDREYVVKVFESPKLAGALRRTRKRRRSLSADETDVLKWSVRPRTMHMRSSCIDDVEKEMREVSQDTGYGSEITAGGGGTKFFQTTCNNFSSNEISSFDNWKKENKENIMVASTPTK